MEQILAATTVIAAVVLATTSMVKTLVPNNKLLPVINVGVGVSIGLVYAVTIEPGQLAVYGWAGFISGLGAGGFYDLGANIKGLFNQHQAGKLIDEGKGYQDLDDIQAHEVSIDLSNLNNAIEIVDADFIRVGPVKSKRGE